MTTEISLNIRKVDTEANIWADHNPMTLIWKGQRKISSWTLNTMILKDKELVQRIEKELTFFVKENKKEGTSTQNRWDTMKAYARGLMIDYVRKRNRKKQFFRVLENVYRKMEQELQTYPERKKIKMRMAFVKHKMALV